MQTLLRKLSHTLLTISVLLITSVTFAQSLPAPSLYTIQGNNGSSIIRNYIALPNSHKIIEIEIYDTTLYLNNKLLCTAPVTTIHLDEKNDTVSTSTATGLLKHPKLSLITTNNYFAEPAYKEVIDYSNNTLVTTNIPVCRRTSYLLTNKIAFVSKTEYYYLVSYTDSFTDAAGKKYTNPKGRKSRLVLSYFKDLKLQWSKDIGAGISISTNKTYLQYDAKTQQLAMYGSVADSFTNGNGTIILTDKSASVLQSFDKQGVFKQYIVLNTFRKNRNTSFISDLFAGGASAFNLIIQNSSLRSGDPILDLDSFGKIEWITWDGISDKVTRKILLTKVKPYAIPFSVSIDTLNNLYLAVSDYEVELKGYNNKTYTGLNKIFIFNKDQQIIYYRPDEFNGGSIFIDAISPISTTVVYYFGRFTQDYNGTPITIARGNSPIRKAGLFVTYDSRVSGIANHTNKIGIGVYPNPTSDLINFSEAIIGQLFITDIYGKTLKVINATIPIYQIDVSYLSQGVYYISGANYSVIKLVKL